MFYIIVGVTFMLLGIMGLGFADCLTHFLCGLCLTCCGMFLVYFGYWCITNSTTNYYLEAEPLAYNTDTTIFSTPNGYYTANAIYDEDTVYLLTMNGMGTTNTKDDEILVVWKCDEGSVG